MVLVGVWWFGPGKALSPSEPDMVASILDAHLRSLQLEHLTDVASSEQHTVRPWFDGKLDISPPVTDLASEGFPLTGGRLDVIGGRSAAALVYGRRRHIVNLFVVPAEEGHAGLARSGIRQGYQWIHWNRAGMSFWAISDISAGDLEEFARLLQR
jgi:anti-sigma factor RsiW